MGIIDYEAAQTLYLAIIDQAHRDANGIGGCTLAEQYEARAFLADLQGCNPRTLRLMTFRWVGRPLKATNTDTEPYINRTT